MYSRIRYSSPLFVSIGVILLIGCGLNNPMNYTKSASSGASRSLDSSNYYVDSSASNASDTGLGSITQPWKSVGALGSRTFTPGDVISFKRGTTYSGVCTINSSGTSTNSIKLTTYGSGEKPSFSNSGNLYVFEIKGSHIDIDNLKVQNSTTMTTWNDTTYQNSGAILIRQGSDNVTVENCEITNVGVGIKSYGQYTTITNNNIHDLVIAYTDSSQSYGAIGVSINNSNAVVASNTFTNCRSTNSPYGADGGAVEIEGLANTKDNISIYHNKSTGSQGFLEVTETSSSNVTLYYNVSDDYQQFVAFDTTTTPTNYKIENNTIIRTHSANATNVFTIFYYRDQGPTPADSWMSIKNNIFYTPAAKVLEGTYTYKEYNFPHNNNIFYDGTSDPIGYSLGAGDIINNPKFVSFSGRDLHLGSDSPAINAGLSLGYATDLDNNPVPSGGAPDCGAYEFQGVPLQVALDPGFENQTSSALGSPWFTEGGGNFGVDNNAGKARTGLNNGWISSSTQNQWNSILQTVSVCPNTTYKLSAYVNSSNNIGSNLWLGIRNANGGNKHENKFTPGASYKKFTANATYTTGASETNIVVYIGYIAPSGTSWIQIDDIGCAQQ
jgi:hypothetical protein